MSNKITREESFVRKRFEKDGFKVEKIDVHNKYKSPDFRISKGSFVALVEVKIGFKRGKIEETLSTGASRIDPSYATADYFLGSATKYKEHVEKNPADANLPYILVFRKPFFIERELKFSYEAYKNYPPISAVFILVVTNPYGFYGQRVWEMGLEDLEKFVELNKNKIESQNQHVWVAIKNPYAKNKIKNEYFSSVTWFMTSNQ